MPVDIEPRTGLTGRRGDLHQAPRRRQVRRRLLQRDRWPARRRRLGRQRLELARLDVEVDRNGATWAMSFRRGVPGVFDGPGPDAPSPPTTRRAAQGREACAGAVTGTRVRYWPDRQIFLKDATCRAPQLAAAPGRPVVPGARPGSSRSTTAASPAEHTESTCTRAASRSSPTTSAEGEPVTDVLRCRAATGSPRPCRCWTPRAR
jgi:hypothetical protein